VLLVRRIRELLYEQGFTISGARNRLDEGGRASRSGNGPTRIDPPVPTLAQLRAELEAIRALLRED
jgi:hypothetical protein